MRNLKFLLAIGMAFGFSLMIHASEQIPISKSENLKFSVEALHLKMPFVTIGTPANEFSQLAEQMRSLAFEVRHYQDLLSEGEPKTFTVTIPPGIPKYHYKPDLRRELHTKLHAAARLKM